MTGEYKRRWEVLTMCGMGVMVKVMGGSYNVRNGDPTV